MVLVVKIQRIMDVKPVAIMELTRLEQGSRHQTIKMVTIQRRLMKQEED